MSSPMGATVMLRGGREEPPETPATARLRLQQLPAKRTHRKQFALHWNSVNLIVESRSPFLTFAGHPVG
jgi:hypothetical protein